MTIRKLTDAALNLLHSKLIAPKYATQLTAKEIKRNAEQLQEDTEKDRTHKPKYKTELVGAAIGLFNPAIAGAVWNRLEKTCTQVHTFPDFQTLKAMTLDIITRYMSSPWCETLAGSETLSKIKRVACGDRRVSGGASCPVCKNKLRRGEYLNRAECKNVQEITTKAYPALPEPTTFEEWFGGLMIECCSWSYCRNRGYLNSDERLTHADWETVYRHAPRPHSLGSLSTEALYWINRDHDDKITGVLLDAWLGGEIDERTQAIIDMKATAKGVNTNTHRNGKPIKLGLKNLHRGLNDIGIASTRAQTKQSLKDLAEVMTRAGYDKKGNWYGGHETEHATSTVAVPATGMIAVNSAKLGSTSTPPITTGNTLRGRGLDDSRKITQERLIELLAQINQPKYSNYIGFGNAPEVTAYNRRAHIGRPRQPEEIKQATEVMLAEKKRLEEFDRIEKTEKEFNQRMKRFTIDGLLPRLPKIKKPLPEMDDETRAIFGLPTSEAMQRWSKWSAEVLAGHIARAEEKGIVIDA